MPADIDRLLSSADAGQKTVKFMGIPLYARREDASRLHVDIMGLSVYYKNKDSGRQRILMFRTGSGKDAAAKRRVRKHRRNAVSLSDEMFCTSLHRADIPAVSIVMPVYNAAAHLAEAVSSLIAQSFRSWELICVNDGSVDGSRAILSSFAKRDTRIRIIDQINSGAASARNRGFEEARGGYVIFLDSDDVFYPDMLQALFERASETEADVVVSRYDQFREGEKESYKFIASAIRSEYLPEKEVFRGEDIYDHAFQLFSGMSWNKLFRKDHLLRTGYRFQDLKNSNDTYFVFMNLLSAQRIAVIKASLMAYRLVEGSLVREKGKAPLCFLEALNETYKELIRCGIYGQTRIAFLNRVVHNMKWNFEQLSKDVSENILPKVFEFCDTIGLFDAEEGAFYKKADLRFLRRLRLRREAFYADSGEACEGLASPMSGKF